MNDEQDKLQNSDPILPSDAPTDIQEEPNKVNQIQPDEKQPPKIRWI